MEQAFAASMKCSEMMFMTHSPVSVRFFRLSLALSYPPAYPTTKIGGSWLTTWVYENGARFVLEPMASY